MFNLLKLNEISDATNNVLTDNYNLTAQCDSPDAIVLRSYNMHEYDIPSSVLCVGRAGAGVNNIPIDKCSQNGIVVFNTPGANANAVKELVICGLLLAGRKVSQGIEWATTLKGKGEDVAKLVEKGKNSFVGSEIYGKTLGIIGLGAIGALVANAAIGLGMKVIGYDPYISIDAAWHLDNRVYKETDIDKVFANCDFISLHVPLNASTKHIVNTHTISLVKKGSAILNFARGELADNNAVINALASKKLSRYVTDFPCDELLGVDGVICIPHLGASTPEAEDNCAVMVTKQIIDYLENGNITNSVNFPSCVVPRLGETRITVFHKNVKNVLSAITSIISSNGHNISNMVSQSKGDYAYLILDIDEKCTQNILDEILKLDTVLRIRVI
ncbi:MAG: phosphoglycerate dehydrogenase [Clostridia bacterium]|nr:phosphoglycerate dehydrogenase [Clostridia bacterium]